jgi:phytanoyl-CoA hydroxylase
MTEQVKLISDDIFINVPTVEKISEFIQQHFPETKGLWNIVRNKFVNINSNKEWIEAIYNYNHNSFHIIFYTFNSGRYWFSAEIYNIVDFDGDKDINTKLIPDVKNFLTEISPSFLTLEQKQFYEQNGYLIIPNIINETDIISLKKQIKTIIQNTPKEEIQSIFTTGKNQNKVKYDYFLSSTDGIKLFLEDCPNTETTDLLINKIGHALHKHDPFFSNFTHNDTFRKICHAIGVKSPIIPQSMYIFKSPGVGGKVHPHQDATFLYTEPQSCHAFWMPLENVTKENGCLWVIPGSHKGKLVYRFKLDKTKNITYFDPAISNDLTKNLWLSNDYVPIEVPKGSLVLLHGYVVHKSAENLCNLPRDAYTFHIVDAECEWSQDNWIQQATKFVRL